MKSVTFESSSPRRGKEQKLPDRVSVRYLYQPDELDGGLRRATDPIWSLKTYNIRRLVMKEGEPILYYLKDGPGRAFVREELLIVPNDTVVPP